MKFEEGQSVVTIDTKAIRDEYPFDPNLKGYRTWDREDKLGPPPWDDTPELRKREEVHQHDVRQKCYLEYGCALVEHEEAALIHLLCDEIDQLREKARRAYTTEGEENAMPTDAAHELAHSNWRTMEAETDWEVDNG